MENELNEYQKNKHITKSIIIYIMLKINYENEFYPIFKLIQLLYLVDWRSTIVNNTLITNFDWELLEIGPYSSQIESIIRKGKQFKTYLTGDSALFMLNNVDKNLYLDSNTLIKTENSLFSEIIFEIVDKVIDTYKTLTSRDFIKLLLSTYPILSVSIGNKLDLISLSREYKSLTSNFQNGI